jgi:hypothetical protein
VLWRNTQRQIAGKNKATDTWSETHLHKFYQMWEELPDGAQRFAVGSDDANVQVQGFRVNGTGSPDTLFVAINSLRPWKASDAPTKVDLSWVTEGTSFGSDVTLKRLFFDRTTRTPTLTTATLDAVPESLSLMPEELVLLKLELSTPSTTSAEVAWYTQVETVATYQSTQTITKLNHTRPAYGLPFPTLPTTVAGMVSARISLGGLNETLAAALAALNVELLSGHACTVKPGLQIAGETRVNPNDGSFMGAMEIDCGSVDGTTAMELRVWSTRAQDDGLVLTSAVLVVKTRSANTPSSVPSSVPASSSAPSPVNNSPSSVPSPTPTTLVPTSSSAPSPVNDPPISVPSPATKTRATPSPATKKPDTTTPSPIPVEDETQSTIAMSVSLKLPPTASITTEELQAPNVKQGLEGESVPSLLFVDCVDSVWVHFLD